MSRNKLMEDKRNTRLTYKKEERDKDITLKNPGLPCTNVRKTEKTRSTKEFYKTQLNYKDNVGRKTEVNRKRLDTDNLKEVTDRPTINKVIL